MTSLIHHFSCVSPVVYNISTIDQGGGRVLLFIYRWGGRVLLFRYFNNS
ncbi:hypothetical protein MC7420_3920 [Coleofasciculus chthonoplastes PCC 7420]|uniref:Uncharacterized protein n=1 Tax=Coleofasciculus chthonoplastes PCC 7420 TaxID=118168 RepID=B4VU91_9CYAN|nr:hypothetical protein MC7420_3920 [Coleofasciculus chthonoplastes PCC 7420]